MLAHELFKVYQGKNVNVGYQMNENNINSLHWHNVVLKKFWTCFKKDTAPKCLLQSTILNAKEGKYNSKKPGGVEDSTHSSTHSKW